MVGAVARPNIGRPTHFQAPNRRVSEALLDSGTTALADGRWAEARSMFEAVLATADLPRAHHGLAEALWWLGQPQASLIHRERAFVGFRRAGEDSAAAAAAIEACVVHLINFGNGAAAAGLAHPGRVPRRRRAAGLDLPDARLHGPRGRRGVRADAPLHRRGAGNR
jgi:hypothetical protein